MYGYRNLIAMPFIRTTETFFDSFFYGKRIAFAELIYFHTIVLLIHGKMINASNTEFIFAYVALYAREIYKRMVFIHDNL